MVQLPDRLVLCPVCSPHAYWVDQSVTVTLVAVELVLESGSLSADHILNVLARLASTALPPRVETSLQLKVAPVANTARYDRLRATDEENRNA